MPSNCIKLKKRHWYQNEILLGFKIPSDLRASLWEIDTAIPVTVKLWKINSQDLRELIIILEPIDLCTMEFEIKDEPGSLAFMSRFLANHAINLWGSESYTIISGTRETAPLCKFARI